MVMNSVLDSISEMLHFGFERRNISLGVRCVYKLGNGIRLVSKPVFAAQHNLSIAKPRFIAEELSSRSKFLILVALDDNRVVGYKIGYQDRQTRFYSWFGGVYAEYRGKGIASELMRRQHECARLKVTK